MLGMIGVGNKAAMKPLGTARDVGNGARHTAASARLGRGDSSFVF